MKVLLEEMLSNTNTYENLGDCYDDLFRTHYDYLHSSRIKPSCDKIPYTYWIPKFHKPVLSQRFIVSYGNCAVKPLANKLSLALGVVVKQIESFGNMLYRCTGVKHYWVVNNSMPIVNFIGHLNKRKAGRNITTYDFTTLYTMLEHSDILNSINDVIDLAFKKSKSKYIAVYNKSASWSMKPRSSTFAFDSDSLKSAIKFILDNSYFSIGKLCFKQIIGIPIGVDCAPALANLTLFDYEYKYISKLVKSDYRRALKSNGCFRLMAWVFNIDRDSIYPASLKLKKENEGNTSADILDLSINLQDGIFNYKLFDKRDHFKFEIVNYPHLGGNISSNCGYGVVKSELNRYAKLSSNFSAFDYRKRVLTQKLSEKGYDPRRLASIASSVRFTSLS